MKKIICYLSLIILVIVFSSCEKKNSLPTESEINSNSKIIINKNDLQKVSELKSQLNNQTEEVKLTSYDNLTFVNDFSANVPDVESFYELKLSESSNISPQECFEIFDNLFNASFSDVYNESDKAVLYRFISDDISEKDVAYPNNNPAYFDYEKEILDGSVDFSQLYLDTSEGYLCVYRNGYVHALNRGKTSKKDGKTGIMGLYFPSQTHEKIADYTDISSEDSYKLLDKKVSIKDAVKTTEDWIKQAGFTSQEEFHPTVTQVKVFDLDDGVNGYSLSLALSYKDVAFDVYNMENDSVFGSDAGIKSKKYDCMPGNAFMLESDSIDLMVGYNSAFDVEVLDEYKNVLSFTDATRQLSNAFSSQMKLNIKKADLMYARYFTDEEQENELTSELIWKFTATNDTDTLNYVIYINAINGEDYYYTY